MISPFFVARLKICVLRGHTVKEFAKGRDLRMEPLIQMTNIFKTYGAGDVQVAALKQREPFDFSWRICRDHRPFRFWGNQR